MHMLAGHLSEVAAEAETQTQIRTVLAWLSSHTIYAMSLCLAHVSVSTLGEMAGFNLLLTHFKESRQMDLNC